ncbi:MAG: trimethylamine methyltransferase family protein, partial [Desulfosalsimonas sp.]
ELSSLEAGLTEMGEYLGFPVFSAGGCSDSKAMDAQSSIEASLSIHSAMLSGPSLVHDVGFMESGMCGSVFQLVLADEIIAKSQYIAKGVLVNEKTLSRKQIHAAGPGGDYRKIKQDGKKDETFPETQDEKETAGNAPQPGTVPDRIVEKTRRLIKQTQSPAEKISEDVRRKILKILEEAG